MCHWPVHTQGQFEFLSYHPYQMVIGPLFTHFQAENSLILKAIHSLSQQLCLLEISSLSF